MNWYDNKKLVIVLLIVFFPVGLFALWKNSQITTKTKGIITGVIAVVFGLAIISGEGPVSNSGPKATPASAPLERRQQVSLEIVKLKPELADAKKRYDDLDSKYIPFQISGNVKDRDEGVIQIWGVAVPQNHDFTLIGACPEDSNIIVVGPLKERNYGHWYGPAFHYFSEKKYSKNALGGQVPVFVFGGPPADLARAKEKYNSLSDKMDALEDELARLQDAALSPEERAAKTAFETLQGLKFVHKGQRTIMAQWVLGKTMRVHRDHHYGWLRKKNPFGPGYLVGYATWASNKNPEKHFHGLWIVDGKRFIPVDTIAKAIALENPKLCAANDGLHSEKEYVDLFNTGD